MTTFEIIADAIRNKKQIVATYNGYYREMCPHVLGYKNGKEQCLFYQFGGTSSSGLSSNPNGNWRCIEISKLQNVDSRIGDWYSFSKHTRPQSCVDTILVEVS